MGGRLVLGYVQLTFILKRVVEEAEAREWLNLISAYLEKDDDLIEVFLDDYGNKDVEV